MSPPSPPQASIPPTDIIKITNVLDTFGQDINPLTTEDLKIILDQSKQQAILCKDPVLVSIDELQKLVESTVKDKVSTQEPPSITTTSSQFEIPTSIIDATRQKKSPAIEKGTKQTGQTITSDPKAQIQSALPQITIIDHGR